MVFTSCPRGNHVQFTVLDQGARHPRFQRDSVEILLGNPTLRTPIIRTTNHILKKPRKRTLALPAIEPQIAVIAPVFKSPGQGSLLPILKIKILLHGARSRPRRRRRRKTG